MMQIVARVDKGLCCGQGPRVQKSLCCGRVQKGMCCGRVQRGLCCGQGSEELCIMLWPGFRKACHYVVARVQKGYVLQRLGQNDAAMKLYAQVVKHR